MNTDELAERRAQKDPGTDHVLYEWPAVEAYAEERLAELKTRLRALHKPFGIYDECGHDHTGAEHSRGECIQVDEVGLTCEAGLLYEICLECCYREYIGQSEECAAEHDHDKDRPICKTAAILEGR
jgi:hypothetical protein